MARLGGATEDEHAHTEHTNADKGGEFDNSSLTIYSPDHVGVKAPGTPTNTTVRSAMYLATFTFSGGNLPD